MFYPEPIAKLIDSYSKLPGIGPKTAERLALFTVNKLSMAEVESMSKNLIDAKLNLFKCKTCGHITDVNPCHICTDKTRDQSLVAVVEESKDVIAIEKMREYRGLYHVLNGVISPLNGVGPQEINLPSLINRLKDEKIKEVILATSTNVEGESTSMYISKILKNTGIKVTRIARGLPIGGDLEYTDEVTLLRAIEGRREL